MEYSDQPQPELLITVPNPNQGMDYTIKSTYPEFTSLCPLAATQPDYATIIIEYQPNDLIIELKSEKFYFVAYRCVEIFHEAVVGNILRDLVNVCHPKSMVVTGDFTTRGGIHTTITAKYEEK